MNLQQLNAAGDPKDLSIPSSNQLEALKRDRKAVGDFFNWRDGHAFDVEVVDYH